MLASPGAETFLWRRKLLEASRQARFSRPRRRAAFSEGVCAGRRGFTPQYLSTGRAPTGTSGQRLHTGQNLLSVALLGNGLQVQTGDYKGDITLVSSGRQAVAAGASRRGRFLGPAFLLQSTHECDFDAARPLFGAAARAKKG